MPKQLTISFHGRLIQHLGIQMYQKPDAALAEMISNAWDADSTIVTIALPETIEEGSMIEVADNGNGMTFEECQDKFLLVGRSRRGTNLEERTPNKKRPVLGRKGIGKFAGFGIAKKICVETISELTGEKTVFEMDIDTLLSDAYAEEGGAVTVIESTGSNPSLIPQHGTKIVLKSLTTKPIEQDSFLLGMSRRFLLAQQAEDFSVTINGTELRETEYEPTGVQYKFPEIYQSGDYGDVISILDNTSIVDGWGITTLPSEQLVKWKVNFYKLPIQNQEFRGVAVYANGKLAQSSFMFNLTGGLSGQHGQEYISGQVKADYIDTLAQDVISTERQRINWETELTTELQNFGQELIKHLLVEWQKLRQKEKEDLLDDRMTDFEPRLSQLEQHERKTVETAIKKLAGIDSLTIPQFTDLGGAILTSWEMGRNKQLIGDMASAEELAAGDFLNILVESSVLSALSMAEGARTRLETVSKLKDMIAASEKENIVRDYIAKDAWIIKPNFELFRKEMRATSVIESAKAEAGDIILLAEQGDDYRGRVDLVISNGDTLVLIEFMRPGLTMDWDHMSRFERYVSILRTKLAQESTLSFKKVEGYIVADRTDKKSEIMSKIATMKTDDMFAMTWGTLIDKAVDDWKLYLQSIVSRTGSDARLLNLLPPGTIPLQDEPDVSLISTGSTS